MTCALIIPATGVEVKMSVNLWVCREAGAGRFEPGPRVPLGRCNGDTTHTETRFSESSPLMLPNPRQACLRTAHTHARARYPRWHLFTTAGRLVGEVWRCMSLMSQTGQEAQFGFKTTKLHPGWKNMSWQTGYLFWVCVYFLSFPSPYWARQTLGLDSPHFLVSKGFKLCWGFTGGLSKDSSILNVSWKSFNRNRNIVSSIDQQTVSTISAFPCVLRMPTWPTYGIAMLYVL